MSEILSMNNQKFFKSIIGMGVEEATKLLHEAGYKHVIISGRPQLLTSVLCRDRITLDVVEGKVVSTSIG
jgi:hypothetical protein